MFIPEGFTEEEVLKAIESVVRKLSWAFTFGYYDLDDLKQEGRIFCLKALPAFDREKGRLEEFLLVHVKNRFINLKRDKFERKITGCEQDCQCERCQKWRKRNAAKKSLMQGDYFSAAEDSEDHPTTEMGIDDKLDQREIIGRIDQKIPLCFRKDYLRYKSGVNIPKLKREKLIDVLKEIMVEEGYLSAEETEE